MSKRNKFAWLIFSTLLFGFFLTESICAHERSTNIKGSKIYKLSICALFKNEANFLKEWIEYHRLIGVDHFYLYNIGSTDKYMEVLNPYIKENIVTLVEWTDWVADQGKENSYLWALGTQIPVYEHNIKLRATNETKWLVFMDIDEFLVFNNAENLSELLEKYNEFPGITLISDYFDSSKKDILPKKRLLIETLTLTKAPQEDVWKEVSKTIFKPEHCKGFTWPPYKCSFKNNQVPMTIRKRELRINNYLNRDIGFFQRPIKQKLHIDNRDLSDEEQSELLSLDYEMEDNQRVIYRFVPDLQRKMGYDIGWNW